MIRLLAGDCRDVLATLPAESVQCVVTSPPYYALRSYLDVEHPDKHREIGSEATPDEYLATMVGVFREVRRVLRRDGTCWVNMGDSYAASSYGSGGGWAKAPAVDGIMRNNRSLMDQPFKVDHGLKPKDLLLMPARLALALQADGWWVRSDIIWHKPNPMPESCTDRPTSAHEHVFLLTRSSRYYYDAAAIAEPSAYPEDDRKARQSVDDYQTRAVGGRIATINPLNSRTYPTRACRNVWSIATSPYPNAHFATYPAELAERCIKAGTSERGCCAACGKPWVRVTEQELHRPPAGGTQGTKGVDGAWFPLPRQKVSTTTGWAPGCQCGTTETRPCVVLDPFIGAGTTALVADRLQRDCIGVDLNVDYTEMAMERCRADAPLFTSFPPAEPPEDMRMADLFTDMAAD